MQVANDEEQRSNNIHHAEGFVVDDDSPPPSPSPQSSTKAKDCKWRTALISVILFITGICIVFLPPKNNNDKSSDDAGFDNLVDRQAYYNYMLETYAPLIGTPQEKAIEWLAFGDDPLSVAEWTSRLDQRYALVVLYYSHGGDSDSDSATWNSIHEEIMAGWVENGRHECDWKGVDCNTQLEVTGLRLMATTKGIQWTDGSPLSSEIGLLSNLESLYLIDQRLQGTIPSNDAWKKLSNLRILDLSNNEIRSTIPKFVWEWNHLHTLLLGGNLLSGSIPDELDDSNIERLEIQHNLGVEGRMEGLLTAMPKLRYLDVSSTSVSGFLPAIEIENIQELHASGSFVTGTIPSEIGTWSSLRILDLGHSHVTGTIPSEFGLLESLEALTLRYNSMNGTLPTELSRMENLSSLGLQFSSLTGSLPTEYGRLIKLVSLDLAYNSGIHGSVPPEYGFMESLKILNLHGTGLTGTVDSKVCSLHLIQFTADCVERRVELDCNCCTECFNLP